MPEKSGYESDQEEFWHPDGSGRKVSKEVFERETAARQGQTEMRELVEDPRVMNPLSEDETQRAMAAIERFQERSYVGGGVGR